MSRSTRKQDHLRYALKSGQSGLHGLSDVHFVHNAIPGISLEEVSIASAIGDLKLRSPIFINAMTGGSFESEQLNAQLSEVAREAGLAIAVGSQMAAFKDDRWERSYRIVREKHPQGLVFANLGSEATVEQGQRAVDMIEANALQIHLNVVQELTMPEGDRNFSGVLARLESLARSLPVPIWVKEVGFGLSREVAHQLVDVGVQILDVGGKGGTNFAHIENFRRKHPYSFFEEWGIRTAASLLEVSRTVAVPLTASGGIQTALHVAKCFAMGADAVGMAGFLLRTVKEYGVEEATASVKSLLEELRVIMTALGVRLPAELQQVPLVISGETREWLEARGYGVHEWGNRSTTSSIKSNPFRP